MVQLSARPRIGKVSAGFGVVAGLLAIALGTGLVLSAESAFGRSWASVFVVFGVVSVLGAVMAARPIDPDSAQTRTAGVVTFVLLGGWAAVTAVVGAVEETWLWAVLLGAPAVFLLWLAVKVGRAPLASPRP